MVNKISSKKLFMISIASIVAASILLVFVTYSWFRNQRKLTTATWIKTPIVLTIGSGDNHDIKFMDMGDIDVESETSKDYVICVYGTPIDNYSLQLAYTTNIAFHYEVYRASILDENDSTENSVTSEYTDENGDIQIEYFKKTSENEKPIIEGKTLTEIVADGDTVAAHQSHKLSYGDENGQNAIATGMVQSNAEPLYWLAEEDGANVLKPLNQTKTVDGEEAFLDYFIVHVSWNPDEVSNDKETDIVYLTASR